MLWLCHKVSFFRQLEKQNWNVIFLYRIRVWMPQWQNCWKKTQWRSKVFTDTLNMIRLKLTPTPPHPKQCSCNLFTLSWQVFTLHNIVCWGKGKPLETSELVQTWIYKHVYNLYPGEGSIAQTLGKTLLNSIDFTNYFQINKVCMFRCWRMVFICTPSPKIFSCHWSFTKL